MVLHNTMTGLRAGQVVLLVLFAAVVVGVSVIGFRRRPGPWSLLVAAVVALGLSLLSSIIGSGNHSGMTYAERLGWPIPFHTVMRNIELGTDIAVPFSARFDALKFLANTAIWGFLAVMVTLLRGPRDRRFEIFCACATAAFLALTLGLSYQNARPGEEAPEALDPTARTPGPSATTAPLDPAIVAAKRRIIESAHPDLADFEYQPSFAGTSVTVVVDDGEYWFAYILHGSGLLILEATCFRADLGRAYIVGEFPDPLDSWAGYSDVDPRTCRGIK